MMSLEEYRHPVRVQHSFQCVRNLLTDPLLDGKALGEETDHAGQLGDADDVFVSNVPYISVAVKRKGMMFAERVEGNGSLQNLAEMAVRVSPAFSIEDAQQLGI